MDVNMDMNAQRRQYRRVLCSRLPIDAIESSSFMLDSFCNVSLGTSDTGGNTDLPILGGILPPNKCSYRIL